MREWARPNKDAETQKAMTGYWPTHHPFLISAWNLPVQSVKASRPPSQS